MCARKWNNMRFLIVTSIIKWIRPSGITEISESLTESLFFYACKLQCCSLFSQASSRSRDLMFRERLKGPAWVACAFFSCNRFSSEISVLSER